MREIRAAARLLTAILWLMAGAMPAAVAEGASGTSGLGESVACPTDARWGLVIDAGSSGSRLRLYCWRPGVGGAMPWIRDAGTRKHKPGIADEACTRTPEEAVAGLRALIDAASEIVDRERRATTPLTLMATGGLRRCPRSYQDAMLAGIRQSFATPPFADPRALLISGAEEGRYGWIGVNYLLRRLDPDQALQTVGALDLGGASTQITFMPRSCTGDDACGELAIGDLTFPLYTWSYLGWGQDEAMRRVASRACYLRGYRSPDGAIVGRGRHAACRRAIRRTIRQATRSNPPEPACRQSCNPFGVYQPPLLGDFIGFSAFAYTTDFLGLDRELTLAEIQAAGKAFCRTGWPEAVASCEENPRPDCKEEWLNRYCFSTAYIVTLLHEVYGLPMDRKITSSNQLAGEDIDWTLGVMVQMAGELEAAER